MFKQSYYQEIPSRTSKGHWSATYEFENNNCKYFSVSMNYTGGISPFYTIKQGSYSCPISPVHIKDLIELLTQTYNDKTGNTTRNLKTNQLDIVKENSQNGTIQED